MNCILYNRDCVYSAGLPSRDGPSTRKRGGTKARQPSISTSLHSRQQEYLGQGQETSIRGEQLGGNTIFAPRDTSSAMHGANGNTVASMGLTFPPQGAESAGMHHSPTFGMDFTSALNFDDLNNPMGLLGERYVPSTPESPANLPCSATSSRHFPAAVYNGMGKEFTLTAVADQSGSRVVGLDYFKSQSSPDTDQASPAGLMIWKDAENNKFIGMLLAISLLMRILTGYLWKARLRPGHLSLHVLRRPSKAFVKSMNSTR